MPTFTTFGDSCLEGAGGYSLSLGFWWHLPYPEEVKLHRLLHKRDNADDLLISINVLEFVTALSTTAPLSIRFSLKNPQAIPTRCFST